MFEHLHDSQVVESGYLGRGWRRYRLLLKPRCELILNGCDAPDADLGGLWWQGSALEREDGRWLLTARLVDEDGGERIFRARFDSAERF